MFLGVCNLGVGLALLLFTLVMESSPSKAENQLLVDERTNSQTQELIFAETLARFAEVPDSKISFIINTADRANSVDDLRANANNGQALDRDVSLEALKAYTKFQFPGFAPYLNSAIDYFEKSPGNAVSLTTIPPDIAIVNAKAAWARLPDSKKRLLAEYLAEQNGTNYGERFRSVQGGQLVATQVVEQLNARARERMSRLVSGSVSAEKALLEKIRANQSKAGEFEARRKAVEVEGQHLRAGLVLSGFVFSAILPPADARKVNGISSQLLQMHSAVKQFGPSGLTPDKLLMFTNVVSAGVAIFQILGPQPADPTMVALSNISQQLREMEARLGQRIENLTEIVVDGFDKLLRGQIRLEEQFGLHPV